MKITPPVHLLRMWERQKPHYTNLFCEAIDNAFDAAAMRIRITQSQQSIKFEDDGVGIDRGRVSALFAPGEHAALSTTQLGQFGIGITTQAIAAGNRLEVDSVSSKGRLSAEVDWRDIIRRGEWEIDDPVFIPVVVGEHTGTMIRIGGLRPYKAIPADKIVAEIADRFHPALIEGRAIFLNGTTIDPISDPRLTDIVEQEYSFDDGRRARLRAGILVGTSRRNRVHVSYAHRVIMPASPFGCDEYGGIMKMFARLQLSGGGWSITPYKDDLADAKQRNELETVVLEDLRPILEKCQAASFNAKIAGIKDLIVEMLPPHLAPVKPQKTRTKKSGQKRKEKRSAEIDSEKAKNDDGPARSPRPKSGPLKIDFEGTDAEDGIAGFRRGPPPRINLPPDNPLISALLRARDNRIAATGLLGIVMCVYEHHRREGQLPIEHFGRQVADLLTLNADIELPQEETLNPPAGA